MLNKLGKLLKYEFLFYFRILLPLCLAVVLIAVAARFQMIFSGLGAGFLFVIYGALIVAMIVINIILIIQRFIDNFMKDTGALMFTLPVTVWALVASKAIAAFCMILISFLAVFVSGLIYATGSENFTINNFNINDFRMNTGIDITRVILPACTFMLAAIQQICLIYVAITVSHMLSRFRFVVGFVLYCAINSFMNRIESGLIGGYANTFSLDASVSQVPLVLMTFIFAALFFWLTGFLLKRSFNLE